MAEGILRLIAESIYKSIFKGILKGILAEIFKKIYLGKIERNCQRDFK